MTHSKQSLCGLSAAWIKSYNILLCILGCNSVVSSTWSTLGMFLRNSSRHLVCRMYNSRTLQIGATVSRFQWRRPIGQDFPVSRHALFFFSASKIVLHNFSILVLPSLQSCRYSIATGMARERIAQLDSFPSQATQTSWCNNTRCRWTWTRLNKEYAHVWSS